MATLGRVLLRLASNSAAGTGPRPPWPLWGAASLSVIPSTCPLLPATPSRGFAAHRQDSEGDGGPVQWAIPPRHLLVLQPRVVRAAAKLEEALRLAESLRPDVPGTPPHALVQAPKGHGDRPHRLGGPRAGTFFGRCGRTGARRRAAGPARLPLDAPPLRPLLMRVTTNLMPPPSPPTPLLPSPQRHH